MCGLQFYQEFIEIKVNGENSASRLLWNV